MMQMVVFLASTISLNAMLKRANIHRSTTGSRVHDSYRDNSMSQNRSFQILRKLLLIIQNQLKYNLQQVAVTIGRIN